MTTEQEETQRYEEKHILVAKSERKKTEKTEISTGKNTNYERMKVNKNNDWKMKRIKKGVHNNYQKRENRNQHQKNCKEVRIQETLPKQQKKVTIAKN